PSSANVDITMTRGDGPKGGDTTTLTLDDQNLPSGSTPNAPALTQTDTLDFTAGAANITSVVFDTDLSALDPTLTWTRVDDFHIVGKDGATTVVEITLTPPGVILGGATGSATITVKLDSNYDH